MQYCFHGAVGDDYRRNYQNYAIQWAAYKEALYACDTVGLDYFGLISAEFDTWPWNTDLMTSHALVAAGAEQADQYDSDDEAYAAARHEELHQIAIAPQSPNMQRQPYPVVGNEMDLVSMECHDGDNNGEQQLNDSHQQLGLYEFVLQGPPLHSQNTTRIMPDSFVCCECGSEVQVVCPSGYCTPCCEMEMCGCDNQDNDYSSSSDDDDDQDGDADSHASGRKFARI